MIISTDFGSNIAFLTLTVKFDYICIIYFILYAMLKYQNVNRNKHIYIYIIMYKYSFNLQYWYRIGGPVMDWHPASHYMTAGIGSSNPHPTKPWAEWSGYRKRWMDVE